MLGCHDMIGMTNADSLLIPLGQREVTVLRSPNREAFTPEGVVGDRHRDGDVDADHARVDAGGEVSGGVAVAGEIRNTVAVFVLARQP